MPAMLGGSRLKVPLMHNGRLHGYVTSDDGENLEMSVHLDIPTGELLEKRKSIEKRGDHYEILL
jgi:hypothetical protein